MTRGRNSDGLTPGRWKTPERMGGWEDGKMGGWEDGRMGGGEEGGGGREKEGIEGDA